jgi:hypothetical protein
MYVRTVTYFEPQGIPRTFQMCALRSEPELTSVYLIIPPATS